MAGHSKWATTKRHKAAVDAKRGKLFSVLSKEITIAVQLSGPDLDFNARLRTVVDKAKAANMPMENIKRAIKKGKGELGGPAMEEITYEGYAPGGVGIIVCTLTDNKNRTASGVRSFFNKFGGNLASPGALSYNFQRKSQFIFPKKEFKEELLTELAVELDAEDLVTHADHYELIAPMQSFDKISHHLAEQNLKPQSSEIAYLASDYMEISDEAIAKKIINLIENLEQFEDTQAVYSNFDLSDELVSKF